jgi:Ser/Thr protein kinase RdoA (MazF antagonist)
MLSPNVQQALTHYHIAITAAVQIDTLWNTVLRLTAVDGRRYALRLCNPLVTDRALVEQEIAFVSHVARLGQLRVPTPVANCDGDTVTVLRTSDGSRIACLFEWIDGEDLRGRVTPHLAGQIGRATALLHQAAHIYPFPVDGDGLRETYRWDEQLVLSHYEWINVYEAQIGVARSAGLRTVVGHVVAQLRALPKTRQTYGLIHADLHQGNLITAGSALAVIDFDQLGRGHFAYDLANIYTELTPEPAGRDALWRAVKDGYREVGPLPFASDADLAPFTQAGELGFLDWYYNSPNPEVRSQLKGRFQHAFATLLPNLT